MRHLTAPSRWAPSVVLAVALLSATALPALAHATFDRAELPASQEVDLVMRVPLERPGFTNAKIEALVPGAFEVRSCDVPSSAWRCDVDTRSEAPDTLVTWQALPAGAPDDIRFGLGITTPGVAGEHLVPVIQTYNDGQESRWIHEDGNEPAPRLTVLAPDRPATPPPASEPTPHDSATEAPSQPERTPRPASPAEPSDEPASPTTEASSSAGDPQPEDSVTPSPAPADVETPAVSTDPDPESEPAGAVPEDEPAVAPTVEAQAAGATSSDDPRSPVPLVLATVLVAATAAVALRELRSRTS